MGLGNTRAGVEKEQSVQEVESERPERRETQEWECQGLVGGDTVPQVPRQGAKVV